MKSENSKSAKSNEMNVLERVKAPTPKFFVTLRTIGLALAAAGGAILASPIALPSGLVAAAGYIILAGGMMSAVSQTAVETANKTDTSDENP